MVSRVSKNYKHTPHGRSNEALGERNTGYSYRQSKRGRSGNRQEERY